MNLFIDTEFNGFGGELISMAIVSDDDQEFYEVLPAPAVYDEWVAKNVAPHLFKEAIPHGLFQIRLDQYLGRYAASSFTLIADWPDDVRYFMQEIIVAPGTMMNLPSFDVQVCRWLNSRKSEVPHNALEDARAIKLVWDEVERSRGAVRTGN